MTEEKSGQPQKFTWNNVPGEDNENLKNFLRKEFGIDWTEDAEITKSDDCMIIHIFTDDHSAEIIMDDNEKKAILKIREGKTHNLKVKKEDGKLNIYFSSISKEPLEIKNFEIKEYFRRRFKNNPVLSGLIVTIIVAVLTGVVANAIWDFIPSIIPPLPLPPLYCTPTILLYSLTTGDNEYIHIWEPCKNDWAPEKGWLVLENHFYKININLDHSYYMIFDKKRDKDILVYDDTVKSGMDLLTGCDLGFCDHDADNAIQYATTAFHDTNGIEYEIGYVDSERGFVLIDTKGWDTRQKDAGTGYDVEAEVIFGIFANESYFINAVELSNLQRMGYVSLNPTKDPDEIVQSWVIIDEYKYACMKGGDNANADWEPPIWYNITSISTERKPWHTGSASFSKMHPRHILLGNKFGGGVIFSLPEGIFRFNDSLGVYGDQIPGEFIIYLFFYDIVEFNKVEGYKDLMARTCERYGLMYPNETIDAHRWKTKRYAYVIMLTDKWCDVNAKQVSEEIWTLADQSIEDFYSYQERISETMEDTAPLSS
jgi:hypothetical protein